MSEREQKTLGQLNGRWAMLFKLSTILIPIVATAVSWNAGQLMDIKERVAKIEANRFTAADGLAVWQAMSEIREQMARLPQEAPPKWFADKVDRIEINMDRMSAEVAAMRALCERWRTNDIKGGG